MQSNTVPDLAVFGIRFGFLALLWLFVLAAVRVIRTDLNGTSGVRAVARPTVTKPTQRKAAKPPKGKGIPRKLLVTDGGLTGTRIGLGDEPITIGRANDSTLVLTDDYASARHARLVPQDGQWLVEDLGSTNGTYLDRARSTRPTARCRSACRSASARPCWSCADDARAALRRPVRRRSVRGQQRGLGLRRPAAARDRRRHGRARRRRGRQRRSSSPRSRRSTRTHPGRRPARRRCARPSTSANDTSRDADRAATPTSTAWARRSPRCASPARRIGLRARRRLARLPAARRRADPDHPRRHATSSTSSTPAGSPLEEAKHHPRKSVILRALTGDDEVEPDLSIREARAGDRYLLCTDGLSDVVSTETMLETLELADPQESADRLVELALRGGGPDNVTVHRRRRRRRVGRPVRRRRGRCRRRAHRRLLSAPRHPRGRASLTVVAKKAPTAVRAYGFAHAAPRNGIPYAGRSSCSWCWRSSSAVCSAAEPMPTRSTTSGCATPR